MSNKTRLQTNNTNLQSLIEKANALPDAGGGGSIEAWAGNIEIFAGLGGTEADLYYTDATLTSKKLHMAGPMEETITIAAGTAIFFSRYYTLSLVNAENFTNESDYSALMVILPTANNFLLSSNT